MTEAVYNIFLYLDGGNINALGIAIHHLDGSDSEKIRFLQSRVNLDCHAAQRFPVEQPLSWGRYQAMTRIGSHLAILESAFAEIGASAAPLMIITPVDNGVPTVNAISNLGPLDLTEFNRTGANPSPMEDYLKAYVVGGAFDIPRLLNDDYFEAIKLLFNARKYVSASKLLVSFIDTMACVEYGDVERSFQRWLDVYADLDRLSISSDEIWEYRNSLLHMTNLASRKVVAGKVEAVKPYIGREHPRLGEKFLNLWTLIRVVIDAAQKWIVSYNETPGKILEFIERYDLIISDARVAPVIMEGPDPSQQKDGSE